MKNNYYMIYRFASKYSIIILCLALMFLHFTSAYPGGMSPDSFLQFQQSLNWKFSSENPPLTAMLWGVFNLISRGPQGMLLFHLTLLWGGVVLLVYANPSNRFRFFYIFIPFMPSVLSQSATIWKDVSFTFGSVFILSTCIFYTYKKKTMPFSVVAALLILCFYIIGVKFQAKFILPILVFFIISLYSQKSLLQRLIISALISSIIIIVNIFVSNVLSRNPHFERFRIFFDIAGVSVILGDEGVLPECVRQSPLYNFSRLQKLYTPKWVDTLLFHSDPVYQMSGNENELQALESAFFKVIVNHPVAYLKHRLLNFIYLLQDGRFTLYSFIDGKEAEKFNITLNESKFKRTVRQYIKLFTPILTMNLIHFMLIILYLTSIFKYSKLNTNDHTTLIYITLTATIFSLVLFFTTMASDYRYYYLVRMLSLMGLPIYLNMVSSNTKLALE